MAYTVLHVLATRLEREGRLTDLDASPLLLGEREFHAR